MIYRGSTLQITVTVQRRVYQKESTQILRNRWIDELRGLNLSITALSVSYVSSNTVQVKFVFQIKAAINYQSTQPIAENLTEELKAANLNVRSLNIKLIKQPATSAWF